MRGVVKTLMEPAVEMSKKDRQCMILLEDNFNGHDDRLAKLEEAIFNVALNAEETLFEKMAKKIKENEILLKTEMERIQNRQEEKYIEFEETLFEQNQKMHACLSVKEETQRLEREQRELSAFVRQYNDNTIDQNKEIRDLIADTTKALQRQLNDH